MTGSRPAEVARLNSEAADALLAGLGAELRLLIASPGSRSTPLLLAARRRPGWRVRMVLDERAAAFVALGAARAGERPVALLCTSGSAAGHYLPALMEADADRLPLVVLSADRPADLHGCGAPQTTDQHSLFRSRLRSFRGLGPADPPVWAAAAAGAVRAARWPIPGPVHLNVPFAEPLWVPDLEVPPAPDLLHLPAGRAVPDPRAIAMVVELIGGARRGVLFCGATTEPGIAEAVDDFASATAWPVLAEPTSGVRFRCAAAQEVPIAHFEAAIRSGAVPTADAAIQIGRAPLAKPVLRWLSEARIRVLIDGAGEDHDPLLGADALVCADPSATVRALAPRLPGASSSWRAIWSDADRAVASVLRAMDDDPWEGAVARAVVTALGPHDTLWVASSMPIRDVSAFALRGAGCRFLANRGLNGIDGLVACSAGAALAGRRITLLCGDLALLHDSGGLLAAASLGIDLDIVVIDNRGGGIFAFLPISEHHSEFRRSFALESAASVIEVCRGAGARVVEVERPADLGALLAERGPGLRVLVVRTEPAVNVLAHERARAACGAAIRESSRGGGA